MSEKEKGINIEVEIEKEPAPAPRKKGGFLGKLVALILGFLLGLVAGVGGLAGGIYMLVAKTKLQTAVNTANIFLPKDLDLTKYLDESYGEKTVLNLVGDTVAVIKKIQSGEATLNDFNAISPMVETLVKGEEKGLVKKLAEKGIYMDGDEAMSRLIKKPQGTNESNPDVYLTDYFRECVNAMSVKDMLALLGDGTEDHDDKLIMYLLYGKENLHYQSNGDSVTMLQRQVAVYATNVYNEYGDELIFDALTDNTFVQNGVTYVIGTESQGTIKVGEEHSDATLYYVYEQDGETPVFFTHTPISDLQTDSALLANITSRLTIADVMDEQALSTNKVLKYLSDSTIDGLPDAVTKLTVGQVFENDMYKTHTGEDGVLDGNGVALHKGDFLDENGNKTTNPDEYVLKPTWAYMLRGEDGKIHTDLTVEHDMSVLTDNLTRNMQNASINALIRDEIIEIHDEEDIAHFNKNIEAYNTMDGDGNYKYVNKDGERVTTLGGLNVSQMLSLLGTLLDIATP